MSEFLVEAHLGKMPLVSTNKLFKSPSRLIFECCGITRAMPVIIDKIEVLIDFHIYAILEFDILVGYPLENLIQEKPSHGGLDENVGNSTFATHTSCPVSPLAKHHLTHDPIEEVKFVPLFVSPKLACERKCIPSPLLEPKPCPSSNPNKNFCAMDISKATLGTKKDSKDEHECFSFETPKVSCSLQSFQS